MNAVKRKLQAGEPTLGGWVMICHRASAELLAMCGFDWVAIDMEHTSISYETMEHLVNTIDQRGALPMVRIAGHDPVIIKRVLDMGAGGIIVPMVTTAAEARQIVAAAKFPPTGCRSVCFSPASGYGEKFDTYFNTVNDEVVVVAMIEHIDAVNNIDEIVNVEGIDALFFGPYDLSGSMGIVGQFEHPDFVAALEKVSVAAKKATMPIGIHVVVPELEQIRSRIDQGYQFIGCSIDTQMILAMGKQLASAAK